MNESTAPLHRDEPTAGPVAVVLPHHEIFQRTGAGAVSLCVHDVTAHSAYRTGTRIYGLPVPEPLDAACFTPVTYASWIHGRRAKRYLKGVIKGLHALPPALIEIHNRPVYIDTLREAFPHTPVLLYIHNDPHTMRGLREPGNRRRVLERTDAIVCVSDYIRRRLLDGLEEHPLSRRVHVVFNGVDTTVLQPARDGKAKEIVFVGRLSPQKGGLIFADAAAALRELLPDWRFVLIGARRFGAALDSEYERQVVARMEQLGHQGVITGYIPRDQVFQRLASAAICVIPSTWEEPFCLAAAEAMSAGCAVVASRRGALPEVVSSAGLLFSPDRPQELVTHIRTLVDNPELLQRYQRAGRERAVQALDIRICAAGLDVVRTGLMKTEKVSR
jgi:glycosyltransferase involved in cell wall biosynthesis